jgi:predicted alpha/beta superfamily hydrolase
MLNRYSGDSGHRLIENGAGDSESYIPFLNDIEETKAWIHESIAIITEPTRKIATSFYQYPPRHSYYHGCSTGGAQGFALAQFHPHLFDGIYAGSPGNWYSHLMLSFIWNGQHANVRLQQVT